MAARIEAHELLLEPVRARLYGILRQRPQSTLSELSSEMGRATSTVLWHVSKLKSAGLVVRAGAAYQAGNQASPPGTTLAEAVRVVRSVPARELLSHLARSPGQHLGQAASLLGAPRSRYWRAVRCLEAAGLVRVRLRGKARLLYATPLGDEALRRTAGPKWRVTAAKMTRRPSVDRAAPRVQALMPPGGMKLHG